MSSNPHECAEALLGEVATLAVPETKKTDPLTAIYSQMNYLEGKFRLDCALSEGYSFAILAPERQVVLGIGDGSLMYSSEGFWIMAAI